MTSELRPAVAVWQEAYGVWGDPSLPDTSEADHAAAAVIQAYGDEREAKGRAEQAAELAKFKALAETLAGALEDHLPSIVKRSTLLPGEKGNAVQLEVNLYKIADRAAALSEVLRQYKEARDD